MLAGALPQGRHPGERLVSAGGKKADHSDEDAATTFIAQELEIAPRWWRITTTAHPVWRLPRPARICSRPRPKHGHAHLGLVTRLLPAVNGTPGIPRVQWN